MALNPSRAWQTIAMKSSRQNQVRIGAGVWRSRVLAFPDVAGLRPTSDRVRETVFNWLGQTLQGNVCLDAFAGSGALGFEAASRGADAVTVCEADTQAVKSLIENQQKLQANNVTIVRQDVLQWLKTNKQVFDIVFCDPPFAANLHRPFLTAIRPHLAPGALVYVESAAPLAELLDASWQLHKSAKAGAVYYGLLNLA